MEVEPAGEKVWLGGKWKIPQEAAEWIKATPTNPSAGLIHSSRKWLLQDEGRGGVGGVLNDCF